ERDTGVAGGVFQPRDAAIPLVATHKDRVDRAAARFERGAHRHKPFEDGKLAHAASLRLSLPPGTRSVPAAGPRNRAGSRAPDRPPPTGAAAARRPGAGPPAR